MLINKRKKIVSIILFCCVLVSMLTPVMAAPVSDSRLDEAAEEEVFVPEDFGFE